MARASRILVVLAFVASGAAIVPASASATFPGGNGRIAFTYGPSSGQPTSIYTADPNGSGLRMLTNDGGQPSWSADGRRIVFIRNEGADGQTDIFSMNANGGGLRRITDTPTYELYPSLSPGGSRIVFQRYTLTPIAIRRDRIVSMRLDGSDRQTLATKAWGDPEYSPDGRRIVYVGGGKAGIWVMARNGTHKRRLTREESANLFYSSPHWDPSGERIAFNRCEGPCTDEDALVVHADGPPGIRYMQCVGDGPVFAPSGGRLAFAAGQIFIAGTSHPPCSTEQVTNFPVSGAYEPSWQSLSSDGHATRASG